MPFSKLGATATGLRKFIYFYIPAEQRRRNIVVKKVVRIGQPMKIAAAGVLSICLAAQYRRHYQACQADC